MIHALRVIADQSNSPLEEPEKKLQGKVILIRAQKKKKYHALSRHFGDLEITHRRCSISKGLHDVGSNLHSFVFIDHICVLVECEIEVHEIAIYTQVLYVVQ